MATGRPSFFEEVLRETLGETGIYTGDRKGAEEDEGFGKNPTRTWPGSQSNRDHVRSCIEFSAAEGTSILDAVTPTNPGGSALVDLRTSSRLSNPFLDLMFSSNLLEGDDEEDQTNQSNSQSLSLSLLSNEEGDSDSGGTLSEVFDSLSRFSEACLASAEAITSATCSIPPPATSEQVSTSSPSAPIHAVYDSIRLRDGLPTNNSYASRGTSGVHDMSDCHSGSGGKMDSATNVLMYHMSMRRGSCGHNPFAHDFTDEPDQLPDPSSVDSGAGTSMASPHRQENLARARGGQQPSSSRAWSDYGSGSDAGNVNLFIKFFT